MYYLNSRYYDPEVGRFINADSQINASIGILGLNIFVYCINNPLNLVDCDGNKPGDLFDTMDEAAKDFANYINSKSISENREYASYIYTKKITYTVTYRIPVDFLPWWLRIFTRDGFLTVQSKKTVIKYTYREPKKGTKSSSHPPINWFGLDNKTAILHTHAAYDPKYNNDAFSSSDKKYARRNGIPIYVVTPSGIVRKYDPADESDILLFTDLPFDPKHPSRK